MLELIIESHLKKIGDIFEDVSDEEIFSDIIDEPVEETEKVNNKKELNLIHGIKQWVYYPEEEDYSEHEIEKITEENKIEEDENELDKISDISELINKFYRKLGFDSYDDLIDELDKYIFLGNYDNENKPFYIN